MEAGGAKATSSVTVIRLMSLSREMPNKEAVAEFNANVKAWGKKVDDALRLSVARWIDTDKKLSKSLKQNYRHYGKTPMDGQEITSIGFGFKA